MPKVRISGVKDLSLRLLAGIAGGVAAGLALPRINFWPAILISVALIHLAVKGKKFWAAFGIALPAGIAFYASQSSWLSAYLGPEPWLALAVLEGLIFAAGMAVTAGTWRLLEAYRASLGRAFAPLTTITLSLIWVAREWVACNFPYGGYQWSRVGQSLANTWLTNLAYFGGISLVSFAGVALAIGGLFALSGLKQFKMRWSAVSLCLVPGLALVLVAAVTPGIWALEKPAKSISVMAVQGNANAGLFANPIAGSILTKHLAETYKYLAGHPKAKFDLMVWPENSSDVNPLTNPIAASDIRALVAQTNKPLLVGAITTRGAQYFNSGLLYQPGIADPAIYNKRRPVPFGEYVPDRAFWHQFAPNLIDLIYRGYTPGNKPGIFKTAGTTIGDLICFEIGIDGITHDLVTHGATLIVSQANNSDFGHTDEAFQQEALVRLQAIATGRAIVHTSTVATTEIVTAQGQVVASTTAFAPDVALGKVGLEAGLTPAMRFYGWLDWLAGLTAATALIWILLGFARRKDSGNTQTAKLKSNKRTERPS